MADGITLNAGSGGAVLATDDIGGVHYQINKLAYGALDSATLAASGAGAVSAGVQRVTLASDDPAVTALQILDNIVSGSEAQVDVVAALPAGNNNIGDVDVASIAAGDNNIGNVDIVTFPAEAHSADYDSGAGTDTTLAFGIAVPAAGGAAVVPGSATAGLKVDLGADNDVTVTGTVTANLAAGTNNIGDVDVLSIAAGTNAIGNVGLVGRTTGGMSIFRSIDLDESEEEIKATAGQIFSISAFNRTAAPLYLKFYNLTAANTTVGTSTPVLTFVVPANADSDGAGFIWNNTIGFAFSTAISAAVTTGVADADTGAPGANDCVVNVGFV